MRRRGFALRAVSPVDHLGFVDREAVIILCGEARRDSDGAVDIDRCSAATTDEMVVVVADPVLVAGRRPCRLNPSDQVLAHENGECVVYGLARDRPDARPDVVYDLVRSGVGAIAHRLHHRETLRRDTQPVAAQDLFE